MTRTTEAARPNTAIDLARMMIKQAKLLKGAGLVAEARDLAKRAMEMNTLGHAALKLEVIPVRVDGRRR